MTLMWTQLLLVWFFVSSVFFTCIVTLWLVTVIFHSFPSVTLVWRIDGMFRWSISITYVTDNVDEHSWNNGCTGRQIHPSCSWGEDMTVGMRCNSSTGKRKARGIRWLSYRQDKGDLAAAAHRHQQWSTTLRDGEATNRKVRTQRQEPDEEETGGTNKERPRRKKEACGTD